MAETPAIIIIKKKAHHGGHHGGAWKVAYADFVTAMMALFIVLWLMNASKPVQQAVGGYFKDPKGISKVAGTNKNGAGDLAALKKQDMQKLKEELLQSVHHLDPLDKLKNQIEITITQEGLRIELMESSKGTFFELGSAKPTDELRTLLQVLAKELGELPNKISVEGHTDSTAYSEGRTYDNWDLSADRANAARRMMQESGVRIDQISQVRGFADQRLRLPLQPQAPSNRRISVIVQYLVSDGAEMALPVTSCARKRRSPRSRVQSLIQQDWTGPAWAVGERAYQLCYRTSLSFRLIEKYQAAMGGSGIRHARAKLDHPILVGQEHCPASVGWQRMAKLQPHTLLTDLPATPRQR